MAIEAVTKYSSAPRIIIVWSLVAFVFAEVTLRLRGDSVVYGLPFALVCYTTVNASSQYAAFYRYLDPNSNGILVAYITSNGSGFCHPSESTLPNYNYSCNNDGKEITLTVPGDNLNEHNTSWRCINRGGTILASNNIVSVFVNVPVSLVQLSPADNVTITEMESRTFTCTTSFCRPEAFISWWKNDANITSMANASMYDQNTTTGILVYTGKRLDNGQFIVCKAWNGYGYQQTSQQIILDIRYAPAGPPKIGSFLNGSVFSVIENTTYTVACIVVGGNPLAYLSWNCFGLPESSSAMSHTVTSTISLNVNRTQDHQPCQCVSTQEIQGNRTAFVTVNVLYPPSITPFTSEVKVIEGQSLELLCRAEGNPPPKLTWIPLGDNSANESRLYYHNISRKSHGNHICTATNTMKPTTGNQVTMSDSKGLVVEVLYAPVVVPFPSSIKVIEGRPLVVECNADGNPFPNVTWDPRGDYQVNQSRLYYHNISRKSHGMHNCTATNIMTPTTGGNPVMHSDSKGLIIDILYPPVVTPFELLVRVIDGSPLEVVCTCDGNPIPDLTWSPQGEDSTNKSRLYYHNVTKSNNGTHRCTASSTMTPTNGNPVNMSDVKDIVIDVLYPPVVTSFQSPVRVVEGDPLEVVCRSDGNPFPDLRWSPPGEDAKNKSRLYYHNINRNNNGTYRCTANSTMRPTNGSPVNVSDVKDAVIDVLYRASIYAFTTKENNNTIMENDSLQLHCQVDSNPLSDIFLIYEGNNHLKKEQSALELNYIKTAECLDAGNYTCRANNSIMNGYSTFSDLKIMVACSPRFDHRKNISTSYYTGLNSSVTLEVFVIAYPEPANITWYHRENETGMWQRVTYQSPSSAELFSSILITLTSPRDFGYYMVTMDNYLGNFNHTYSIIPESIPEVPTKFNATESGPHSLTLEWVPGFTGGHPQHFIIEYAKQSDGDWLKTNEIQDFGSPMQSFILSGLQPKTSYQLRMFAQNKIGPSEKTQVINDTTSDSFVDKAEAGVFPVGVVAGSISGAVVAVVLVIVVLILWRRRGLKSKDKDMKQNKKKRPRQVNGLVDNPVYDSSGPIPGQAANTGDTGNEYAKVMKPKKKDDANTIYAHVDKTKKKLKQGAEKGKHGKTSRGDIYENANLAGKPSKPDTLYQNSGNAEIYCENLYEDSGTTASIGPLKNKDNLLYAELMLDPPTRKNGKVVIRGIENRTEYAEIVYGAIGGPLHESDHEKTSDARRADQ